MPGEPPAAIEPAPAPGEPPAAQPRGRLPVEDEQWTTRFDDHFRKYSKRFFSVAFDWRWFKAQGITESGLRVDATSWVGARGIMQIMPATFQEIAELSSLPLSDTEDPAQNIAAGVFYDRRLYDLWDDIPTDGSAWRSPSPATTAGAAAPCGRRTGVRPSARTGRTSRRTCPRRPATTCRRSCA